MQKRYDKFNKKKSKENRKKGEREGKKNNFMHEKNESSSSESEEGEKDVGAVISGYDDRGLDKIGVMHLHVTKFIK